MAKISSQELLHIAQVSHIRVYDTELIGLHEQLEDVLTYAERVGDIAQDVEQQYIGNSNIMRADLVHTCDAQQVMRGTPTHTTDYFVVPRVIDART
ncbi:MAG: Asp-tRNA(Asn)/Glu-tRNA(Gln) amidotransferase subunit GatC [Candidatus Babeliales bacterium]